jgi:hypothetical protein
MAAINCCSTVTLDENTVTMTYVMWHEERLWNISLLQEEHLSMFGMCSISTAQVHTTQNSYEHDITSLDV